MRGHMENTFTQVPVLIVGGTAAYWLSVEEYATVVKRVQPSTRYGEAAPVHLLDTPAGPIGFVSRHGEGHLQRSARFVNHRANIAAARMLGVRWILSWNGVGALRPDWDVGDLVVITDVVDFTHGRIDTLEEEPTREALWSRPSTPFAPEVQEALRAALAGQSRAWHMPATYACSEGPRLETVAEIRLLRQAGADVVGMTLCPEIWLAQEAGIGYGSLGYITNHATGITPRGRGGRDFGPSVARTCFPVLLEAAVFLISRM